jgi:hypothetical protein
MLTACKHVIESKLEVPHETSADGKQKCCLACIEKIKNVVPGSAEEQALLDEFLVCEEG